MRIRLVVSGTRGDVQPLAVLGAGLVRAGHDARLLAPPENAALAGTLGCPFEPFGADVEAFTASVPEPARSPVKATRMLTAFLQQETRTQLERLPERCAGADVIAGATFVFGVRTVAESLGARYRFVAYSPQVFPSGEHPHLALREHRRPRWFNRLSWRLLGALTDRPHRPILDAARARLGLPPAGRVWEHLLGSRVVLASDPELGGVPGDVTCEVRQVGFLGPPDGDGVLDAELEHFLAAGEPPIYAGFGSMRSDDPAAVTACVVEAARAAGVRVLLAPGWGNLAAVDAGDDVLAIGPVPHVALFARVAAVVHHGGAGTTATAARAGVPQIVVPHMTDQYYAANRIAALGVGPPPLWKARLTTRRLAEAIGAAIGSAEMRRRCAALRDAVRARPDPLAVAIAAITE